MIGVLGAPARLYAAIGWLTLQRQLTYRAAAIAALATNFFFGLLRAAVMVALYGSRTEVQGFSLADAITFTALTQAVIGPLSLFSWNDVTRSIHAGEVGVDLLKPMSYQGLWLARDLGRAVAAIVWRSIPIMLAYAAVFGAIAPTGVGMTIPADALQWAAVVASGLLAWWVSFGWRFAVNLAAFWTPDARGIVRLAFIASWFASGFLMPLRFYPDWVGRAAAWTPFPYSVNTFVEIYLGVLQGPALWRAFAAQLGWGMLLMVGGILLMRRGVRRLVILGG